MLTTAAALSVFVMMLVLDTTLYSLMLVAEQIVHGLHWVECTERNLYKYCIPVTHRTIPETWQLECLQTRRRSSLRSGSLPASGIESPFSS